MEKQGTESNEDNANAPVRVGLPENPNVQQIRTWNRQETFLAAYAQTGAVNKSAVAAECTVEAYYNWVNSDNYYTFQKRFEQAKEKLLENMVQEIDRRAFEGYEHPIWHNGKQVGVEKRFSDNLAMFRIKKLDPSYRENYTIVLDDRDVKGLLDAMRDAGTPRVIEGASKVVELPESEPGALSS